MPLNPLGSLLSEGMKKKNVSTRSAATRCLLSPAKKHVDSFSWGLTPAGTGGKGSQDRIRATMSAAKKAALYMTASAPF